MAQPAGRGGAWKRMRGQWLRAGLGRRRHPALPTYGATLGATTLLLDTVKSLTLPKGDAYAYVAGESEMSKALKTHLIEERRFNPEWIKSSGYWLRSASDAIEPH